jgi:hypothetical protein
MSTFGDLSVHLANASPGVPSTGVTLYSNSNNLYAVNASVDLPVVLNPMTTAGDIILGGASGTPTRLGIGSSGTVLKSNGTTAAWSSDVGTVVYSGTVTLSNGASGSITLAGCVPTSKIVVSYNGTPVNPGILYPTAGTGSFNIASTNDADDSLVAWMVIL